MSRRLHGQKLDSQRLRSFMKSRFLKNGWLVSLLGISTTLANQMLNHGWIPSDEGHLETLAKEMGCRVSDLIIGPDTPEAELKQSA